MGYPLVRPRRLRRTPALRRLVAETSVEPSQLVLPAFVREGISHPVPVSSMPGVVQHSRESLRKVAAEAAEAGLGGIMLFGVPAHKDATGSAALDPDGILNVAIADVVRAHEADGNAYDLVLLGNDAADTGDFQVGIRLASTLGRPVVTGISTCAVADGVVVARGEGPDGTEVFELPLPAVVAVMEGGVAPRYPSIPGRMKAKRAPIETVVPQRVPTGSGRVRWKLPPPQPSSVEILGTGPEAAPAVVDLLERLGVVSR